MSRLIICSSFLSMFSMLVMSSADCTRPVDAYGNNVGYWMKKVAKSDKVLAEEGKKKGKDYIGLRNIGKGTVKEIKGILETGKYTGDRAFPAVDVSQQEGEPVDYRAVRVYDSLGKGIGVVAGNNLTSVNKIDSNFTTEYSFVKQKSAEATINFRDPLNGKIAVLNFGNAVQPCGGFLNGRGAQEESLSRASTVSATLMNEDANYLYYKHNENLWRGGKLSCRVVVSPDVLIFRTDEKGKDWGWIKNPVHVSVVTASAFDRNYYGKYSQKAVSDDKIEENTKRLIKNAVLAAMDSKCETFVLGAFGCGVCANGVQDKDAVYHKIAGYFREVLIDKGLGKHFKKIIFPIVDDNMRKIFAGEFAGELKDKMIITNGRVFGK